MAKDRQRSKDYRSTPIGKKKHRIRQYGYLRLRRHFDEALITMIDEGESLPITELSERIWEKYRVKMHSSTIENLLNDYIKKWGTSPLEKVGSEYRLNNPYYDEMRRTKQ
jgi:hypothetical protein